MAATIPAPPGKRPVPRSTLADRWPKFLQDVRIAADQAVGAEAAAAQVADAVRANLPAPEILTPQQLVGLPARYSQVVLHVEPTGVFSVVALVWRPGQVTPIHDHVSWCVIAVLRGGELETRYVLRRSQGATYLEQSETLENPAGSVCGLAPPGDIHRVRNSGAQTAVSLHVYGADISSLGSSIRRRYNLPVGQPRSAARVSRGKPHAEKVLEPAAARSVPG